MTSRTQILDLVDKGDIAGAIEIAERTDAGKKTLGEAGWELDGTPALRPCSCWFYQRAPGRHDRFLNIHLLEPSLAWATILEETRLEDVHNPFGMCEPGLFITPEEIRTFIDIHDWPEDFRMAVYALGRDMPRIAEQARWGRFTGRTMAMDWENPRATELIVSEEPAKRRILLGA
jgi:hypothetical protein